MTKKQEIYPEELAQAEQEMLTSNSEIYERQLYYLSTVKTYLQQQIEQVDQVIQETIEKQGSLNQEE